MIGETEYLFAMIFCDRFSYDILVGHQAIMISQKHPSGISEYAQ